MPSALELFYWRYPENGYEWQDGEPLPRQTGEDSEIEESRFLVSRPYERMWRYNPLVLYPTLYREFASLAPTEEGFVEFANKYGDLGVGVLLARNGPLEPCDPLIRWREAQHKMSPVVDVLNALQDRDTLTLRRWFTIEKNAARYQRKFPNGSERWGWLTIADQLRDFLWRWATEAKTEDETIRRLAQGWAQEEINEALSGWKSSGTSTNARIVFDLDSRQMTLHMVPQSLLGALWLQCARVLTLNPAFRSCEHCGKWFELSPEARRRQSKYCSDRCKVAAYRARKATAEKAKNNISEVSAMTSHEAKFGDTRCVVEVRGAPGSGGPVLEAKASVVDDNERAFAVNRDDGSRALFTGTTDDDVLADAAKFLEEKYGRQDGPFRPA